MAKLTRETLMQMKDQYQAPDNWIKVGLSSCGIAAGGDLVYKALLDGVSDQGLNVEVRQTGCAGLCSLEPLVEVNVKGAPRTMYGNVDSDIAQWLLDAHVVRKRILSKYVVPGLPDLTLPEGTVPGTEAAKVLGPRQYRIALRNCGVIDPESIEHYFARDGYRAMKKALCEMTPEQVLELMIASGLRGRGGGGFPTGLKWKITRASDAPQRYIICNGDEGDPGAYMDRSVLEGDPHALVEGMIIGGYAMGASQGFFYIRAEYPLAVQRIENAIKQARRNGLLGKDILDTGFNFDLEIRLGAGAFVCGEETALIASVEGKRGTPIPRPPFPSVKGLWESPTCINNVETLANVSQIILHGAEWFSSIGIGKSVGTKVFAVTGKVKTSGLVEIPMGTTIREIVYGICGGSASGKPIKAIQTGGPSGGVIPASLFDTPISYEHLMQLGSIMGSGGMIVMEEGDSMVDIAKFYLGFCVDESCGKCAPCRIGGKQMLLLLEKISAGQGSKRDIETLRKVSHSMQRASLCGLGQTAPNPVLSTLRYFESEYTDLMK